MKKDAVRSFSPYEQQDLLEDKKRILSFKKSFNCFDKDSVVCEFGTGTGVLTMLAAKKAKRVYTIEKDKGILETAKKNFEINHLSEKIVSLLGDASKININKKFDIIFGEMLATGMFYESQVNPLNNLKKNLKANGKIIPYRIISYLELASISDRKYGLFFMQPRKNKKNTHIFSKKIKYMDLDFRGELPEGISFETNVKVNKDCKINSLVISSFAYLHKNQKLTRSNFLFNPETILLKNPIALKKGKEYHLKLCYKFGCYPNNAKISLD